jgi:hypothetical protein
MMPKEIFAYRRIFLRQALHRIMARVVTLLLPLSAAGMVFCRGYVMPQDLLIGACGHRLVFVDTAEIVGG